MAQITPVLPYILAFTAGAALYVVAEKPIPEAQDSEHNNASTIGAVLC